MVWAAPTVRDQEQAGSTANEAVAVQHLSAGDEDVSSR